MGLPGRAVKEFRVVAEADAREYSEKVTSEVGAHGKHQEQRVEHVLEKMRTSYFNKEVRLNLESEVREEYIKLLQIRALQQIRIDEAELESQELEARLRQQGFLHQEAERRAEDLHPGRRRRRRPTRLFRIRCRRRRWAGPRRRCGRLRRLAVRRKTAQRQWLEVLRRRTTAVPRGRRRQRRQKSLCCIGRRCGSRWRTSMRR